MRTITITTCIDVLGALASGTLTQKLYLYDDNRANGSKDLGTGVLKSRVSKGDLLLWLTVPLDPESFAEIGDIEIDSRFCEPERRTYEGTNVAYWEGVVKQDLESVPYRLTMALGDPPVSLSAEERPSLIGEGLPPGRAARRGGAK